jgi:hypothetical protein
MADDKMFGLLGPRESYHIKKNGRIYQMTDWYDHPIPFRDAKRNYTKTDIDGMEVGQSIRFQPMFGNTKPIQSKLRRLK